MIDVIHIGCVITSPKSWFMRAILEHHCARCKILYSATLCRDQRLCPTGLAFWTGHDGTEIGPAYKFASTLLTDKLRSAVGASERHPNSANLPASERDRRRHCQVGTELCSAYVSLVAQIHCCFGDQCNILIVMNVLMILDWTHYHGGSKDWV